MTAGVVNQARIATSVVRERRSGTAAPSQPSAGSRFAVLFPLAVFFATRLYDAVLFELLSRGQPAITSATRPGYYVYSPMKASPGYLRVITNWDGQWYQSLATSGYPRLGHAGGGSTDALQAWAFPPVFPLLTRLVMWIGLPFPLAASVVSLVCGALAMVLLFRLLDRQGGPFFAASGVLLTCCFITAPLMQAAYSESLAMLLLVTAFLTLAERRYGFATATVLVLGFTRIVTPPFALVVIAHAIVRLRRGDRDPVSRRELASLAALCTASVVGAVTWSFAARLFSAAPTGASSRPSATLQGRNWFAESYSLLGWHGPILVGLLVLILVLLSVRPSARRWGMELRTWFWAYPLFILAVTPITAGFLRYMLLCFPLGLILVGKPGLRTRWKLSTVMIIGASVLGLALQWWWIEQVFILHPGSLMP